MREEDFKTLGVIITLVGGGVFSFAIYGFWAYYAYGDFPLTYLYAYYVWLIIGLVIIIVGALLLILRAKLLREEEVLSIKDNLKKAYWFCMIGTVFCLGLSLFWLYPQIRYGSLGLIFLWLPFMIAGVLSIVGIVIARKGRVIGFTLCLISGLITLTYQVIFYFPLLYSNINLYVLNILGPLLIAAGGIIGIKR